MQKKFGKSVVASRGRSTARHKVWLLAASVSLLALCTKAAIADDSQIQKLEAQIQQIEARHQAEISSLRAEIRALRRQRPTTVVVTKGPPGQLPDQPRVIESRVPGYHFGFSDASGDNTVELTGRLHVDTGGYVGYSHGPKTLDQAGLDSGINLRRARIGVTGKFLGDWRYTFIYDFGNTSDGYNPNNAFANANSTSSPGTSNNYLAGVENAYITYNGFNHQGALIPIAIDLPGFQDVPWTLQESQSSNDILFMERSSAQVVATEFGGGDFRAASGIRSNNDRYWVGAYITGPNSGALHTIGGSCNGAASPCTTTSPGGGDQLSALFRAAYQIVQTKDATLHVGLNYANLFNPRIGPNEQGIQLYDRPELRIDPTYFLNSGNIPAHGGEVFGAEAAASYQNFFIQGEYYHYIVDTLTGTLPGTGSVAWYGGTPGPALNFNGGYVEGSYSFGGQRHYNPATAAYTGVIPDRPFAFGTGGWGALEIAARYSTIDLNDPSLNTGVLGPNYKVAGSTTTAGYGGSGQTAYGVGVNWYPNTNMKFMLDYEHVEVSGQQALGYINSRAATIDWIAGRTQIVF